MMRVYYNNFKWLFLLYCIGLMMATTISVFGQGTACIGGSVIEDNNLSGTIDAGDNGLAGLQLTLITTNNDFVATVTTDPEGDYEFCDLEAGSYVVLPPLLTSDYLITPIDYTVAVTAGASVDGNDFLFAPLDLLGGASGIAFLDVNENGVQDNNEPGVAGVSVSITGSGGVTYVTTTNIDGAYSFGSLPEGDYVISPFDVPDLLSITLGEEIPVIIEGGVIIDVIPIVLCPPANKGSLIGTICYDFNGNAVLDGVDFGISGFSVLLKDAIGTPIASGITNSIGQYLFHGLASGTYTIEIYATPTGTTPTTPVSVSVVVVSGLGVEADPIYFQPYEPLFGCGEAVVTCYSSPFTGGGPVMGIKDIRNRTGALINNGPPSLNHWVAPMYAHPSWTRANLGEIFGVAINKNTYDIFVTSTSSYNDNTFVATGDVFKIDAVTGNTSPFVTLPNSGPGLGNICYDPDHNLLFVTNFEDGKIYSIDISTQSVVETFDPYFGAGAAGMDDGTNGFVPLGQRIWGIGYNNGHLYVGRWNHNNGAPFGVTPQQIWSIPLDASGSFSPAGTNASGDYTGSENHELDLSPIYAGGSWSSPVSDITFSENGSMLIGERGMSSDNNPSPHASRTLEFIQSPTWVQNQNFFFGGGIGSNSAGGVDYGYESFDPTAGSPEICDSMVWATADFLVFNQTPPVYVYGIAGTSSSGNTLNAQNGYFIDANGNTNHGDKTEIGDIEIFKCGCGDCCIDEELFCEIVDQGFTYDINCDTLCLFPPLGLDDCDSLHVTWGNGSSGPNGLGDDTLKHIYTAPGTYLVHLTVTRYDKNGEICLQKAICDTITIKDCCCENKEEFCEQFDLGFSYTTNCDTLCIAPIGLFDAECDSITYYWGDGAVTTVPAHTAPICHVYPGPGTYILHITVRRYDENGEVCILKSVCIIIEIEPCDECCTDYDLFCDRVNDGFTITGTNPYTFTPKDLNYPCYRIEWVVDGVLITTTFNGNPFTHFFNAPGVYKVCMRVYEETPDGVICWEKEYCEEIIVDSDCCEDEEIFCDKVNQGFSFNFNLQCQFTFQPNAALNPSNCYQVEWRWNDGSGSTYVLGGFPVNHTFPNSGTFTVCMIVRQYDSNGDLCNEKDFCEVVDVPCFIFDPVDTLKPVPQFPQYAVTQTRTTGVKNSTAIDENTLPLPVIETFPNPAMDVLNVSVTQIEGAYQIKVYDISGKMIHGAYANEPQYSLDVSQLHSGMYFLQVETLERVIGKTKFVKQ